MECGEVEPRRIDRPAGRGHGVPRVVELAEQQRVLRPVVDDGEPDRHEEQPVPEPAAESALGDREACGRLRLRAHAFVQEEPGEHESVQHGEPEDVGPDPPACDRVGRVHPTDEIDPGLVGRARPARRPGVDRDPPDRPAQLMCMPRLDDPGELHLVERMHERRPLHVDGPARRTRFGVHRTEDVRRWPMISHAPRSSSANTGVSARQPAATLAAIPGSDPPPAVTVGPGGAVTPSRLLRVVPSHARPWTVLRPHRADQRMAHRRSNATRYAPSTHSSAVAPRPASRTWREGPRRRRAVLSGRVKAGRARTASDRSPIRTTASGPARRFCTQSDRSCPPEIIQTSVPSVADQISISCGAPVRRPVVVRYAYSSSGEVREHRPTLRSGAARLGHRTILVAKRQSHGPRV